MDRWVPYRNLVYYAHAIDRRATKGVTGLTVADVSARASRQADVILRASFLPDLLDAGRPWDFVHRFAPSAGRHIASPFFSTFLARPTHRSRRALDEISLAYWCAGFDYDGVLLNSYLDYSSIGDHVVKLEFRDIAIFLQFYWNWRIDRDWRGQKGFVDRFCDESDTSFVADIFEGRANLVDVRMRHGVNLGFDTAAGLRRLSRNLMHLAEAGSRELNQFRISNNDSFLPHKGQMETLALATSAAVTAAKAEAEIAESAASTATLQDYIATEMRSDDFQREPPVVSDLQDIGISPDDLYLENAGGNAELDALADEIRSHLEPESGDEMPLYYDAPDA